MNYVDYEQRRQDLLQLQSESLSMKIQTTMAKLMEFFNHTDGQCYISCSGGADSMVLYDIAKKLESISNKFKFKVVFDDTGLEEPTVRATALSIPNITVVKPKLSFYQVLTKYGYPIISKEVAECVDQARLCLDNHNRHYNYRLEKLLGTAKQKNGQKSIYNKEKYKCLLNAPFRISNKCCNVMKKQPMSKLNEKPIVATMTEESKLREYSWYKTGCNSFEGKIMSRPMSFWKKQDVLTYIKHFNIKIADCYGEVVAVSDKNQLVFDECKDHYRFTGCQRTGCIFCMFGCHLDYRNGGENRFKLLERNQPQLFDYCMRGGKFDNCGLWIPDKGLGFAFVISWLNRNLSTGGKQFITGVNLDKYKPEVEAAFKELNKIEPIRKKWLADGGGG